MQNNKQLVYMAMSGGVDSSVSAALLKKDGYKVVGVFFRPWSPSKNLFYCDWKKDRLDAMRVCAKLEIEFKTWDLSKEYENKVVDYMINAYRSGITPNPDIACNKDIKFGIFLDRALSEGADFIATGHYAKIGIGNNDTAIFRGLDDAKDQSYFLWALDKNILQYILFPVGKYTKEQVRSIAKKNGLPNHAKKDSQGICFVGELDMKSFLSRYIKSKKGALINEKTGEVIGYHYGAHNYTTGQRHGFVINDSGGPYYVIKTSVAKNIVRVSDDQELLKKSGFKISNTNWIKKPGSSKLTVKIRYQADDIPVKISLVSENTAQVKCKKDAHSLALGQSAVIESTSADSDKTIRIEVSPEGVERVTPQDATVSIVLLDPEKDPVNTLDQIYGIFCHNVLFFASREEGERWTEDKPWRVAVVSVAEAYEIGKKAFAGVLKHA